MRDSFKYVLYSIVEYLTHLHMQLLITSYKSNISLKCKGCRDDRDKDHNIMYHMQARAEMMV